MSGDFFIITFSSRLTRFECILPSGETICSDMPLTDIMLTPPEPLRRDLLGRFLQSSIALQLTQIMRGLR